MPRTAALSGLLLPLALAVLTPQVAVAQSGTELPALIDGYKMQPLAPQQLDASEQTAYAKLAPGSAEATRFLFTRGFLRYARLVADKALAPKKLPDLPAEQNWDRRYLTVDEGKIVDTALELQIADTFKAPVRSGPIAATAEFSAVDAKGNMSPLTLEQLREDEQATFAKLAPPEATKFLYTRGFLRYAQLVVDKRMEPSQLPWLPEDANWSRDYLSADEAKNIVDVALLMQIVSMIK